MDYDLLLQVIGELNEFEQSKNTSHTLNDFRNWLNEKAYLQESPQHVTRKHEFKVNELDNELCKQVIMLGRYAKQTIRKGLEDFPELVNEDFTYLYRLMDYDSLSKMELIEKNGHEKQTGLETIKRLVRNGLVVESLDDKDARKKRISVTSKGKKLFKQTMKDVNLTAKILGGNLNDDEKKTLLQLLKKLNIFHEMVYQNHKDSALEDIASYTN